MYVHSLNNYTLIFLFIFFKSILDFSSYFFFILFILFNPSIRPSIHSSIHHPSIVFPSSFVTISSHVTTASLHLAVTSLKIWTSHSTTTGSPAHTTRGCTCCCCYCCFYHYCCFCYHYCCSYHYCCFIYRHLHHHLRTPIQWLLPPQPPSPPPRPQ